MAIFHLDLASGLAGDMFLGACLDQGMPLDVVAEAVARLGLPGVTVEAHKAERGGLAGTRFRVLQDGRPIEGLDPEEGQGASAHPASHDQGHHHPHGHEHGPAHGHNHGDGHDHQHSHDHQHGHSHPHEHPHPKGHEQGHSHEPGHGHGHSHEHPHDHGPSRNLVQITELILRSSLADAVKTRAIRLFHRLGESEAKAHGMPIERVHFHEVGAVDSIVDLVGAAAAIEFLAPERITATAVNVGSGKAWMAHGEISIPAPATADLLRGVPIYGGPGGELTTPTGAVLIAELVTEFVELPPMRLEAIGYGLGKKHLPHQPNAVRLLRGEKVGNFWGEPRGALRGEGRAEVMVVETEVDDLPGEGFGFLMERLLAEGALDVYFTPVQMKKNRPGTLVTLLCRHERLETLAALLLAESGSLGCRYHAASRWEAEREIGEVETPFGRVRVKRASLAGRPLAAAPEFEDCRRLALASGTPWREVYRAALVAAGAPAGI